MKRHSKGRKSRARCGSVVRSRKRWKFAVHALCFSRATVRSRSIGRSKGSVTLPPRRCQGRICSRLLRTCCDVSRRRSHHQFTAFEVLLNGTVQTFRLRQSDQLKNIPDVLPEE